MSETYFLRILSKYNRENAKKFNNFLDFDAGLNSISVDYRNFGISPWSAVHFARTKKDFKKSQSSDYEFIFYSRSGYLFFNENGASKGFGRGGFVAFFKRRSLLTSSNFLFSSESEPEDYKLSNTKNTITGTNEGNILMGTSKNDLITGKKGNDTLKGSKGKDYLDGSAGDDILIGGKGADVFQISKGFDFIEDFSIKQGDRIALDSTGKYKIIDDDNGVVIKASSNNQLLLEGVNYDDVMTAGVDLFVHPV